MDEKGKEPGFVRHVRNVLCGAKRRGEQRRAAGKAGAYDHKYVFVLNGVFFKIFFEDPVRSASGPHTNVFCEYARGVGPPAPLPEDLARYVGGVLPAISYVVQTDRDRFPEWAACTFWTNNGGPVAIGSVVIDSGSGMRAFGFSEMPNLTMPPRRRQAPPPPPPRASDTGARRPRRSQGRQ